MAQQEVPIKLLFMHGMESGPTGRKAKWLREAGFQVFGPAMSIRRANFALDLLVFVGAMLGIVFALGQWWVNALWWALPLVPALVYYVGFAFIVRRRFALARDVQAQALKEFEPHVCVGSSFGSAVLVDLINSGLWTGPSILLAPAHKVLARHMKLSACAPLQMPLMTDKAKVVIVHGRKDTVCALAESRSLLPIGSSNVRLIERDDDHQLRRLTKRELAQWVRELLDQ